MPARPYLQLQLPLGGSLSGEGAGIPPDERTGETAVCTVSEQHRESLI